MIDDMSESNVTVRKIELVSALKANRERHRTIFLETQAGYREEMIRVLDEMLADARRGVSVVYTRLTLLAIPQDHTRDYDRVIRMLEMSTADEIKIDEKRFSQLVLDDWGWKAEFMTANATYSKRQ